MIMSNLHGHHITESHSIMCNVCTEALKHSMYCMLCSCFIAHFYCVLMPFLIWKHRTDSVQKIATVVRSLMGYFLELRINQIICAIIDVWKDIYLMMSCDLYGTCRCSHCLYGTSPVQADPTHMSSNSGYANGGQDRSFSSDWDSVKCNYSSVHLSFKVKVHIKCPVVLKLNILEIVFYSISRWYQTQDYVPYKYCRTKSFVNN